MRKGRHPLVVMGRNGIEETIQGGDLDIVADVYPRVLVFRLVSLDIICFVIVDFYVVKVKLYPVNRKRFDVPQPTVSVNIRSFLPFLVFLVIAHVLPLAYMFAHC